MGEPPSFGGQQEMKWPVMTLSLEDHFRKQICSIRPSVSLCPTSVTNPPVGLIVPTDMNRLCPGTICRENPSVISVQFHRFHPIVF